jgi:hypothetical protein
MIFSQSAYSNTFHSQWFYAQDLICKQLALIACSNIGKVVSRVTIVPNIMVTTCLETLSITHSFTENHWEIFFPIYIIWVFAFHYLDKELSSQSSTMGLPRRVYRCVYILHHCLISTVHCHSNHAQCSGLSVPWSRSEHIFLLLCGQKVCWFVVLFYSVVPSSCFQWGCSARLVGQLRSHNEK